MKKALLLLSLIVAIAGHAQKNIQKGRKPGLITNDSVVVKLQKFKDSMMQLQMQVDSNEISRSISNNVDGLLQLQKEQKARQQKAAMIRIGIGVALLAVLFIGLMRKRSGKK